MDYLRKLQRVLDSQRPEAITALSIVIAGAIALACLPIVFAFIKQGFKADYPAIKFVVAASLSLMIGLCITYLILYVRLPETITTPTTQPVMVRQQLEEKLWRAIADNQLPVPTPKTKEMMLIVGELIFQTEPFTRPAFMDDPMQAAYKPMREYHWARREEYLLAAVAQSLIAFLKRLPKDTGSPLTVPLLSTIRASPLIYEMVQPFRDHHLQEYGIGQLVVEDFHRAAVRATAQDPKWKGEGLKYPQHFQGTPQEMVDLYLPVSPFRLLLDTLVPYPFEDERRFEHHWIIGNSGHGKTQTLQHLLVHDLQREDISVVVFDPMDALVDKILELKIDPDRVVLIDPRVFVPAVNFFQIGEDDPSHMLAMYRYLFSALLDSPMTDNQATLFDNCALLLRHVPNATFMDMYRLLDGQDYSRYYPKLDEIGRRFFKRDFSTKGIDGYEGTRKQILRRLNTVMRTYPFSIMFQQSANKLDFTGINEGKIYLINASISKLSDAGSRLFARFFLLLLSSTINKRKGGMPCFVYLDEADQFIRDDTIIKSLLARARQKKVGLILAHRTMEEIGSVTAALEGIASTIFAGGLRGGDRSYMAGVMDCDPKLLAGPKGNWAVYTRGKGTVSINIPFGTIDKQDKLSASELEQLKLSQAQKYGADASTPIQKIKLEDASDE